MNIYKEIHPYVMLVMALVSSTLAVALVCSARNLVGRGWLIAFTTINLVTWPAFQIVSLIAQHAIDRQQVYYWYAVPAHMRAVALVDAVRAGHRVEQVAHEARCRQPAFFLFGSHSAVGILDFSLYFVSIGHAPWVCAVHL